MREFFTIVTLLLIISHGQCNDNERSLSMSIAGMEYLLQIDRQFTVALDNFANELQKKVDTIRSAVATMRNEQIKAQINPEEYLSNPLNGFQLIRKMHEDWTNWVLYMEKPVGEDQIEYIQKYATELPTSSDMTEAVNAIFRLQTVYDLQTNDIATGLLYGKQYDTKFSSQDCFVLGKELLIKNRYYHAGFWLYRALETLKGDNTLTALGFNREKIQEIYAEALLKQDRATDALTVIDMALKRSPNDEKLLQKKVDIETIISTGKSSPKPRHVNNPSPYELGCRGQFSPQISNLHCRYNTTTSPFLRLAPLKMEEVQLDPYMVLYHDVLSDGEIEELKVMARPNLKRATVYKESQGTAVVESRRTSKFSWFGDNTTATTIRINHRIADMTGFDLYGSEMLQVMNYGLGGHYDTHYDFFNVSATADVVRMQGDRISTVLFYMNDVEQGGATVFPNIQTAVFPRKGTAVVWYNLNNRGEGDWKTLHAACPVIFGSKWVCNKWIRERRQAFRRPCYKY